MTKGLVTHLLAMTLGVVLGVLFAGVGGAALPVLVMLVSVVMVAALVLSAYFYRSH